MKRTLRTRLILVKPNLARAVEEKQHQQIRYYDKKGVKSRALRARGYMTGGWTGSATRFSERYRF